MLQVIHNLCKYSIYSAYINTAIYMFSSFWHFQHWKAIFQKYDLDGDGKISYQELRAMIRSSAYSNDIPTRVVHLIMRKADLDASGYLDYPEFIAMVFLFILLLCSLQFMLIYMFIYSKTNIGRLSRLINVKQAFRFVGVALRSYKSLYFVFIIYKVFF